MREAAATKEAAPRPCKLDARRGGPGELVVGGFGLAHGPQLSGPDSDALCFCPTSCLDGWTPPSPSPLPPTRPPSLSMRLACSPSPYGSGPLPLRVPPVPSLPPLPSPSPPTLPLLSGFPRALRCAVRSARGAPSQPPLPPHRPPPWAAPPRRPHRAQAEPARAAACSAQGAARAAVCRSRQCSTGWASRRRDAKPRRPAGTRQTHLPCLKLNRGRDPAKWEGRYSHASAQPGPCASC